MSSSLENFNDSVTRCHLVRSARLLLCQVMQRLCTSPCSYPGARATDQAALRHWLNPAELVAETPRFNSPWSDEFGIQALQEIDIFPWEQILPDSPLSGGGEARVISDDECSRCLDDFGGEGDDGTKDTSSVDFHEQTDSLEQHQLRATDEYGCYLWFVYRNCRLSYNAGLVYCCITGRWVQFLTDRHSDRLLSTRSGALDPTAGGLDSALPRRLHRLLLQLRMHMAMSVSSQVVAAPRVAVGSSSPPCPDLTDHSDLAA